MNGYYSRKFIVTLASIATAIVAVYNNLLTPELSNVLLAAMASYNIANAWATK